MRKLLLAAVTVVLAAGLLAGTALATGDNGQKIGQDPLRLALTKCSNAGLGNGGEFEAALNIYNYAFSLKSECLDKHFFELYSADEANAILAQSTCVVVGRIGVFAFIGCEIDPGNSAAHNANNS